MLIGCMQAYIPMNAKSSVRKSCSHFIFRISVSKLNLSQTPWCELLPEKKVTRQVDQKTSVTTLLSFVARLHIDCQRLNFTTEKAM